MKNGNMRIRAFWICVVVATLFLAQGVSMGEVLKATPDQFDFGTLKEGATAVVTVEVENIGDAPVEITNVRTS